MADEKKINRGPLVSFEGQNTIEIPTKLQIDLRRLEAYMVANMAGYSGVLSAKKFGHQRLVLHVDIACPPPPPSPNSSLDQGK